MSRGTGKRIELSIPLVGMSKKTDKPIKSRKPKKKNQKNKKKIELTN